MSAERGHQDKREAREDSLAGRALVSADTRTLTSEQAEAMLGEVIHAAHLGKRGVTRALAFKALDVLVGEREARQAAERERDRANEVATSLEGVEAAMFRAQAEKVGVERVAQQLRDALAAFARDISYMAQQISADDPEALESLAATISQRARQIGEALTAHAREEERV